MVFEAFYGELLEGFDIDHIDNNGLNNAATNLQQITHRENCQKDKKAEFVGVRMRPSGKYVAEIKLNGSWFHIGSFLTGKLASLAYYDVAKNHGNINKYRTRKPLTNG